MNERYGKLYSLPRNLYLTGSPVLIVAGVLLKDNQTNKVLAQLKFQNIGEKIIKAITVSVAPKDTAGQSLGEPGTYQYLDLCTGRDDYFGQKTAFPFSDSATRSYTAAVIEVIFDDNSMWKNDELNWEPLKEPESLNTLCDGDLELQFCIEYGSQCVNFLLEEKDLWYCVCGAVNHKNESICHDCGATLSDLRAIDMQELQEKKEERIAQEQALEQEKAARKQQEAIEAQIHRKNVVKKVVKLLLLVGIAVAVIFALSRAIKFFQIEKEYKRAEAMASSEQYESAIEAFMALGDYKDSPERIEEIQERLNNDTYSRAEKLVIDGKYQDAKQLFEGLGDYKDSPDRVTEIQERLNEDTYSKAEKLAKERKYQDAMELFEGLGGYKDSPDRVMEMQDAITWKNVKFAGSFLGKKTKKGVLGMSEEELETIQNKMYLFGMPGYFSHGTTSAENVVDLMDWVSSESIQSVDSIADRLAEKYGDNYRVQYYYDANSDAYMWKDVGKYAYVILWENLDGTIDIRWIV